MAFTYRGEKVDLGFGRGWLDRPAARSVWRIDQQIGHPLQITEAGRDWEKQYEHWLRYQREGWPIALHPDAPSIHQKGGAIDSNEAQRIVGLLESNGWRRTVYRWVNGKWTLVEPWHFEYFAHLDKHFNDPASGGGASIQEDDDMPIMIKANVNIYTLSPGQIKLNDDIKVVERALKAGIRQIDLTGSVADQNAQFAGWLDFFGVPRGVVAHAQGWVLNPETGKHERNGMWNWERQNKAILATKK